ncbi:uncharacterized protein C22orf15 isoform X2 [Anguilla anguilla]|uniref:uncharacterized protein C22orf15 isoform X2 n=1 Tax=Anguilla anguilla TaxID=7936 RepID=UPI0015B29093|nr:uncharacterized protein C22orf15 isoform X2 [Anguilla anguilla]
MFVTVQFGECVDLVDKTGELVNLSDREQSAERANYLLRERHTYVLIRVTRGDGTEGHKYEPLLKDLGKNYPELADLLKKLSNPQKERDKRSLSRRGWPQRDTSTNQSSRSKRAASPKKSGAVTLRN